tara:strand:+ start:434 stop:943 length:510 start_codon:yes stop_codon:yes gene_type:complete
MYIKKKGYYEYNRPQIVVDKNSKESGKKFKVVQFGGTKITDDRDYVRPKKTYYDQLQSKNEIKKQLQGYIEVPINKLKNGTHYKYITWDKKQKRQKFRIGGLLKFKRDKFIVLTNGKLSWTVSREFHDEKGNVVFKPRFFRKKTKDDKKDELIRALHAKLNKYKSKVEK